MRYLAKTLLASSLFLATLSPAKAEEVTIPERLMIDLQHDFDLEKFQAAGIVGNLAHETMNFRVLQEINPLVEGSRGGAGYSQWTGVRRVAFEEHAGDANIGTYEVNYAFLHEELSGQYSDVIDDLRETENLEQATEAFMKEFLRPSKRHANLPARVEYAEQFMAGDFSGAGCATTHQISERGNLEMINQCPTGPMVSLRPVQRPGDLMEPKPDYVQGPIMALLAEKFRPGPDADDGMEPG